MSGKVVGWAMEQRTGSPAAKLVLVKLADNADESGYCWPSVALIVEHTELCERSVRGHLRQLADAGFIRIVRNISNRGTDRSAYQLNVPTVPGAERPTNSRLATPAKGAGDSSVQARAASGSGKSCQPNKNLQEPSLNLQAPTSNASAPGIDAPALRARVDALVKAIGQGNFDAWFYDVEFIEGPPPVIILPKPFIASWVRNHHQSKLERIFGEDVQITAKPANSMQPSEANENLSDGPVHRGWWMKEHGGEADEERAA